MMTKILSPALIFREINEPQELVALLKLRHVMYFELNKHGEPKRHGLDFTPHDCRSRFYGVFKRGQLLGCVRTVHRSTQCGSSMICSMRAALNDDTVEDDTRVLPSEHAFDTSSLGNNAQFIDIELGRFAISPEAPKQLGSQVLICVLALLLVGRNMLYMYSCAETMAPRYAKYMNPLWTIRTPVQDMMPGFVFPQPTVAAIGSAASSPFIDEAKRAAAEFQNNGMIVL